ncbi:MAG TPA: copper-binding protein [Anaeromyxobacteraceae bacterium]|nr:copper-binding protein [Anaeromyxobacteraceae bacterium]
MTVPAQREGELVLRHEAIPEFTDKSGVVVGMDSMVMPFPVSANVSLAGLTPGDKIEFVFSVDWVQGKYLIESLKKLPAETMLKMEKAQAMESMGSHMSGDANK